VDFAGAAFEGLGGSANFSRTTFEGGATFFLADVVGRLDFSRATSLGDLSFQDVDIHGRGTAVEFSTARLLGTVSFVDADVGGSLAFDQADVGGLDLEGADFDGLLLPLGEESGGRIGSLRLDLDEAALVVGPGGGTTAQELALKLVENSARAAGDLETANDARVRRLTIARHGMNALAEPLDLIFRFGVWGYGVRPYHQLALIAVMVVLATGIRWMVARGQRPRMPGKLRGVGADLWHSLGALLRLRPPEGSVWSITEYLGFKLLVVLFVLNAANVWPVSRELIEGIF
jgi:hypothetical protein